MDEDPETKTLLDKDFSNMNVKSNPGKLSYLSTGLTIILAILSVTYFTSKITIKSYPAILELYDQAPEPSSTVTYHGKMYASLGGGDVNGRQNKCQSDRYFSLPNGWEIAPDDADSRAVTADYPWDTHVNVMSNGCSYGTASYTKGELWNCGMLGRNGNAYSVNSCSLMILIIKSDNPQAPEPSSTVTYNGKIYASLGGGNVYGKQLKCQSDRFLIPPNGWEIAPDDADSITVTGAYPWDTHVNVMSNGCSYGTAGYTRGEKFSCDMLDSNGAGGFRTKSCSLMVLIIKSNPPIQHAPPPTSTINYKGYFYAILSGGDVNSMSMTCGDQYLALPDDGWELAPDEENTIAVASNYPFGTHVLVMSNGCGYGTATYTKGVLWNCNMLGQSGIEYKVNACNLQILIRKNAPTSKPTPFPTALPTKEPISNPTLRPTQEPTHEPTKGPISRPTHNPIIEPTHEPTHKPSFKPTLEPTVEPTKLPTLHPTFHPTLQPTLEPTKDPTLNPSASPSKDPTLEPTKYPTLEPTANPSKDPTPEPSSSPIKISDPTNEPIPNPTERPTAEPTKEPTKEPISRPTHNPSKEPTKEPTHKPFAKPSLEPTLEPTKLPTLYPTFHPTLEPTLEPTKYPTLEPTANPSKDPTPEPTKEPSLEPSNKPSKKPTFEPTKEPTKNPIPIPTQYPTLEPTLFPTYKSTNSPTSKPTTASPTHQPSLDPLSKPNMCTYEFIKGKSSAVVSSGCVLITNDDIEYMKEGQTTHAVYVCATSIRSVKLDDSINEKLGIKGRMSNVTPGLSCEVTMYSLDNFRGMQKTYTSRFHPALNQIDFPNSKFGNDAVVSILIESHLDSFELSADCQKVI